MLTRLVRLCRKERSGLSHLHLRLKVGPLLLTADEGMLMA